MVFFKLLPKVKGNKMNNTESLKKNNEFKRLFLKGKWYKGKYLVVYFLKNRLEINRLGIAVGSKKITIVERNRIRRVIRESYRINEERFNIGYDIVILWKGSEKEIKLSEIENDLLNLFKKGGMVINA